MQKLLFTLILFCLGTVAIGQQDEAGKQRDTVTVILPRDTASTPAPEKVKVTKTLYGVASYYADKFNGRKTANGEVYSGKKLTAACNKLPLGTWIRVTNLSNNRSVVVKTNDRLHPRMNRIVDLSRAAAEQLGYIKKGLTKVKVEVIRKG